MNLILFWFVLHNGILVWFDSLNGPQGQHLWFISYLSSMLDYPTTWQRNFRQYHEKSGAMGCLVGCWSLQEKSTLHGSTGWSNAVLLQRNSKTLQFQVSYYLSTQVNYGSGRGAREMKTSKGIEGCGWVWPEGWRRGWQWIGQLVDDVSMDRSTTASREKNLDKNLVYVLCNIV